MDWDKLRIFHVVAKAGSFTHAGEMLELSQSAVSRQISGLEESLGVTLFHRHARGLILTEQGDLLFRTASDVFGKLAMIEGQLTDSRDLPQGPLTVTTAGFIGSDWLGPALGVFRTKYPDIRLTLLLDDRVLNLGMREADAAIRLYKPEQQDLIQKHIASLPFVICASASYLKFAGTPEKASDLKNHTLLGFPDNLAAPYTNANWLLKTAETSSGGADRLMLMNSLNGIYKAMAGGAGIACLPRFLVQNNKDVKTILETLRPPSVEMYFVYPEERRNSRRIALFRDFIEGLIVSGTI